MGTLMSLTRIIIGVLYTGIVLGSGMVVLALILPFRKARIHVTNHLGTLLGWGVLKLSGSSVTIKDRHHANPQRPAIYIGNHTSIFDAFTSIWLTPKGTVGVAKKEIIYYPFYGLAWLLAGHPTVDRSNSERAKASMNKLSEFVRRYQLSICMWPEGTRARDGRLLPFKKGIIHLAIQTGLPIVPMVTVGATEAWQKSTLSLQKKDISVRFLPAIDTSHFKVETLDQHLEEVRKVIIDALPEEQRPQEKPALKAA